jgi:pimeloyl-ACP methyl ester carboxylesterase
VAVVELHHRIEGSGPDLVMLHGGAGGISDLDALRARLAPGHRVISPDQRGHGRSIDPGEISYAAMAADTAALLDGLGVRAADVVGWSDGGVVGLLLTRDRPDLVGRLVSISGNLANDAEQPFITPAARAYLDGLTPARLAVPEGRAEAFPDPVAWPATAARIIAMWRVGNELTVDDLRGLAVPVLYIAADRDIVPLVHTVAMYEATPTAQLAILPKADHGLAFNRVDEVAPIIERFLAEPPPAEPPPGAAVADAPPTATKP